jgi:hypothetical protein
VESAKTQASTARAITKNQSKHSRDPHRTSDEAPLTKHNGRETTKAGKANASDFFTFFVRYPAPLPVTYGLLCTSFWNDAINDPL